MPTEHFFHFVLDKNDQLDFYIASSLKQQFSTMVNIKATKKKKTTVEVNLPVFLLFLFFLYLIVIIKKASLIPLNCVSVQKNRLHLFRARFQTSISEDRARFQTSISEDRARFQTSISEDRGKFSFVLLCDNDCLFFFKLKF